LKNELLGMNRSIRNWVKWDAQDGVAGYDRAAPAPRTAPTPLAAPEASTAAPTVASDLDAIRAELGECTRCKLHEAGRSTIVFGEGNPNADIVFVGEGPGYHEDRLGRPFVGKAGELLDKMIGAMGLQRSDVYICNVVKCRPPKNRDPEPDEVMACQPFLHAQIRAIQPKAIVAMGRFAAQTLLDRSEGINRLRGTFYDYLGTRLMPTFHPAYLLRNPSDKGKVWADLQAVMAEVGLSGQANK
jgi:DNA polymerase